MLVVDTFAGPGGWDVAARQLGLDPVGYEWEAAACATRAAAGLATVRADVADVALQPLAGRVAGFIGSPPCTMFSRAGTSYGNAAIGLLLNAVGDAYKGSDTRSQVRYQVAELIRPEVGADVAEREERRVAKGLPARTWADLDGDTEKRAAHAAHVAALVIEPARWVHALGPKLGWVALEQVPDVLPVWERMAGLMRRDGWHVWVGVLNAADYGVPQRRRRAILIASRTRSVACPPATHCEGGAEGLFGSTPRWVTMAEALGWAAPATVGFPRRGEDGDDPATLTEDGYRARDLTPSNQPAQTVTEKARSWQRWEGGEPAPLLQPGGQGYSGGDPNRRTHDPLTEPAPTVAVGRDAAGWQWVKRLNDQSGDGDDGSWCATEPATTIAGRGLVPHPGSNANRFNGATKSRNDGIRITLEEAARLQSFPDGYPWQGSQSARFQQVGNAIPPLLALHVLAAATGVKVSEVTW